MKELNGKVAVVTGAASGIGLAMSEQFASEGMKVVMADVEEEALAASASRLQSAGADVLGVLCDVSDAASVQDLASQALSAYGGVQVVCNNAGVAPAGPMLETTAEEWAWIVGVNVLGVAHGVMAFAPLMVEAGEGHIVNTASEAGLVTTSVLGMYCATKHAVVGLSESLWRELHPQGVGVSCLCPNLVATRIFHSERKPPLRRRADRCSERRHNPAAGDDQRSGNSPLAGRGHRGRCHRRRPVLGVHPRCLPHSSRNPHRRYRGRPQSHRSLRANGALAEA